MSDGVQDLLGDRVFGMDPHATLLTLARQFVAGAADAGRYATGSPNREGGITRCPGGGCAV